MPTTLGEPIPDVMAVVLRASCSFSLVPPRIAIPAGRDNVLVTRRTTAGMRNQMLTGTF